MIRFITKEEWEEIKLNRKNASQERQQRLEQMMTKEQSSITTTTNAYDTLTDIDKILDAGLSTTTMPPSIKPKKNIKRK
jgi:hypothetical protein